MHTHFVRHPSAVLLAAIGSGLQAAARVVHGVASRLDRWLIGRQRAAADRTALAAMSERELRDIGIGHASIDAVARLEWVRDFPR